MNKLKIKNGKIVDLNGKVAINKEGFIDKNATTFWSATEPKDGNEIKQGGVRNQLSKQISRKIFRKG